MGPCPHLWFCAFTTATLWPELHSLYSVPDLTCRFVHAKQRLISTRIASLYGSLPSSVALCMQNSDIMNRINSLYRSQTSPVVLCMQNSDWLAPESQVSMGPSTLICGFCIQNSDFRTRITSLYGFQTSPMFFCIQNSDFSTRIAILYGSQPSSVVLCIHNSDIMQQNY